MGMTKLRKRIGRSLLLSLVLIVGFVVPFLIWQRHSLIAHVFKHNPSLLEAPDEPPGVTWFDDYYTVQRLADGVYAIGEPRYWQRNYNYLIVGGTRALLIDAGPGVRDIRPVVESLTALPYTLVLSHVHFDHIGNGIQFPRVAMIDLPHLRDSEQAGTIQLTALEHLGKTEGFPTPALHVHEWLAPSGSVDLGGRTVRIVYTPGHTTESISLFDRQSNILFTGDWFTPILGPFLSNSSMGDLQMALENALRVINENTRVFGAHKYVDGGGAPMQSAADIRAVRAGLDRIRSGELRSTGFFPAVYQVTPKVELYSDITWLQRWSVTYPRLRVGNGS